MFSSLLMVAAAVLLPAGVVLAQTPGGDPAGPTNLILPITGILGLFGVIGALLKVAFAVGNMTGKIGQELQAVRVEIEADRRANRELAVETRDSIKAHGTAIAELQLWKAKQEGAQSSDALAKTGSR